MRRIILPVLLTAIVALIALGAHFSGSVSAGQGKGGEVIAKPTPKKTATPKRNSSRVGNGKTSAANKQHETITNRIGMELVWIPPGTFMMGSENGNDGEKPVHRVTFVVYEDAAVMARIDLPKAETEVQTARQELTRIRSLHEAKIVSEQEYAAAQERYQVAKIKLDSLRTTTGDYGFFMGKYEVTQSQWLQVMDHNASLHRNCGDCPVESVSWYDAQEFLDKLNDANDGYRYRLPTEAEWEYACRAGKTGDDLNKLDSVAWYGKNSMSKTHPVGKLLPNPLGLYDMRGNVWEWCLDWYHENYNGAPTDGSVWLSGGVQSQQMMRGGSSYDRADRARSTTREIGNPPYHGENIGFRVVAVARAE